MEKNYIDSYDFLKYHMSFRNIFKNTLRTDKNPISKYEILLLVKEKPNLKVGDISDIINITRPNLTPLIDELANDNLIEKITDSKDRRIIRVKITDTGVDYLNQKVEGLTKEIHEFESQFSKQEIKELSDSLKSINKIMSK